MTAPLLDVDGKGLLADVAGAAAAALADPRVLVLAHANPALFALGDALTADSGHSLALTVPGHEDAPAPGLALFIDLEEARWNDAVADIVILEPEPNYWTVSHLLEALCAVEPPRLVMITDTQAPLTTHDAYPPGSAVPMARRHAAGPAVTEAPGRERWMHAASDLPRSGVRAAIADFAALEDGLWTILDPHPSLVVMVHRDAPFDGSELLRPPETPRPESPGSEAVRPPARASADEIPPKPSTAKASPVVASPSSDDASLEVLRTQRQELRRRLAQAERALDQEREARRRVAARLATREQDLADGAAKLAAAFDWQQQLRARGDALAARVVALEAQLEIAERAAASGALAQTALRQLLVDNAAVRIETHPTPRDGGSSDM